MPAWTNQGGVTIQIRLLAHLCVWHEKIRQHSRLDFPHPDIQVIWDHLRDSSGVVVGLRKLLDRKDWQNYESLVNQLVRVLDGTQLYARAITPLLKNVEHLSKCRRRYDELVEEVHQVAGGKLK